MNLNKILANFKIADVTVWKCLNISKHSEPLSCLWDFSKVWPRMRWDHRTRWTKRTSYIALANGSEYSVCVCVSSLSTSRSTHTLDLRATRGLGCLLADFQTWGTHWCLIRNTPNRNVVRHKVSCAIVSPTRKQHYFCFCSTPGIRPVQA